MKAGAIALVNTRDMDPRAVAGIVGAASALVGSLIGGLFAMWTATRAHRRQLELQQVQLRGQTELKARELMFGVYQRKIEEFNSEIKQLAAVIGKLGMVMHISDIDEREKMEVRVGFIATVRALTDPIIERIAEIESELSDAGLLPKYDDKLSFVKKHLTPDLARITPQQLDETYQSLSKALAYINELQAALVERKSQELFSEYLPSESDSERSRAS